MVGQPIRVSLRKFGTWANSKNFYKIIKSSNRTFETGQHSNHYLHRRYVANGRTLQVNLELSAISSNHNFCRVPSKQVESQSRLRIQKCNRLARFETLSAGFFSENNQTLRNPNSRSVCLQVVSPASPIYDMEARFKQFCNRYNAAGPEQNVCFGIPTFQPDRSCGKQDPSGKSTNNNTSDTNMVDTTLVYSPTKNVHTISITFTSLSKPFY